MVNDKFQVRTTGPVNQLTGQPIKGRAKGGGIRVGEMERDALLAHGAAYVLQDRLLNCSDYTRAWVCRTCGGFLSCQMVVAAGGAGGDGKDLSATGERRRSGKGSGVVRCRRCATKILGGSGGANGVGGGSLAAAGGRAPPKGVLKKTVNGDKRGSGSTANGAGAASGATAALVNGERNKTTVDGGQRHSATGGKEKEEDYVSKVSTWEDGEGNRYVGGEDTTVVAIPGVLRYLDVELAAMGVKMTYRVAP